MKKTLLVLAIFCIALFTQAQDVKTMYINYKSGETLEVEVAEVESITFTKPATEELSVETYILDDTTHPFYIGGRIHNNNNEIVKKGIIISTDEDNLFYDEEIVFNSPYTVYSFNEYLNHKVLECRDYSNEQFNIPLNYVLGNTEYYARAFVINNQGEIIYGNAIEITTENFNRYNGRNDYANVWYYNSYTLFDLVTDEYIDRNIDGYYYSTNENPTNCNYQIGNNYNSCYKFKTEWNYRLWYYHNINHCCEDKIVGEPIMELIDGKLHIKKQEKDADKNIEIYYSINENGRRPEKFTQKYDTPLEINEGDIVYCYAVSDEGYISYTNIYKRFSNQ